MRSFLPRFAYAETVLHRNDFLPEIANDSTQTFLDHVTRADFQTLWSRYRHKPGIRTHLLALLIRVLPKVGPLSDLAIKIPTEHTQDLYVKSMNRSIEAYAGLLKQLAASPELAQPIANFNLDTGEKSQRGAYTLMDKTYARLLHETTKDSQRPVASGLKQDILDYYSGASAPVTMEKHGKALAQIAKDLAVLRNMPSSSGGSKAAHDNW
ncbi:MAG: hypothetical protein ACRD9L_10050 [Bryobacteraceae bacterium]